MERKLFTVRQDDLTDPQTLELLALHLTGMHANSPVGTVFALDLSGLRQPEVSFWSAWSGSRIASIAALKQLPGAQGEVKSMRTHPDFIRKGAANAILDHVILTARARRLQRLSLETGSGSAFEPAHALYRNKGFLPGEAFADYQDNGFSQFFHLELSPTTR
ncbi:N-acetyltransferase [Herbaspirillum rubrisubalbicans Os34]|uniref:N-acetyltransferase n=1 Tax=Herbaspirillum rubrisubalbicans Os34 TaxID=1235827 RepID=A0A6M3ZY62_9BURK|nr:GNAT family N-acetyltransferase [Herbaspirillum rubrisubalbicans]QJQ02462.1 N-acetyltransferase [Herbaspirillum rubrisubalbicans Os34]